MVLQKQNYPIPSLRGLCYDTKTIFDYRDANQILCMRLDLSYDCNIDCKYCYTDGLIRKQNTEARFEEILDVINQGIDLGIKSAVILGGEPLIYPHLFDVLEVLRCNDIVPVIFTNGISITPLIATKLSDLGVSVIVKFDGLQDTQDFLCGQGYSAKRLVGLNNLLNIGYNKFPKNELRLGCASVVTKVNLHEIENLWRYFRNNNIFPHIERMTVKHEGMRHLSITDDQAKNMTEQLRLIDYNEYGILWDAPYPAIPGYNCSIFYAGCHVDPYLGVSLCPELQSIGNANNKRLKDILSGEDFEKARNIENHIEGKCKACIHLKQSACYGCRSKVFHKTGSIFGEDTDCTFIPTN